MFKEKKEDLIKIFTINKETKVSYLIKTLLEIINRWDKIRIYIFNTKGEKK